MSAKDKLLAATANLQLPPDGTARQLAGAGAGAQLPPMFPPVVPGSTARTGPGQMLQFRQEMLAAEQELTRLRADLERHQGALPTRKIDPRRIRLSPYANRHADAFLLPQFESLKRDIEHAGGNVQPILVRPIPGETDQFEVVFGHRRHRACLDLGLPVLAMVESSPISDLALFAAMDRENRERADLSAYEQGVMYRRALDGGLFPSARRLAEALGVSHTWVNSVLTVADLPQAILECFRSPLEVQYRHAKALGEALAADRKTVLRRAERLRQHARRLAPGAVVEALVRAESSAGPALSQPIESAGKVIGRWQRDRAGRLTIQLESAAVPEDKLEPLLAAIAGALQ